MHQNDAQITVAHSTRRIRTSHPVTPIQRKQFSASDMHSSSAPTRTFLFLFAFATCLPAAADDSQPVRCRIVPGAHQNFEVYIDGRIRSAWNFSTATPRPFLYPVIGPSGQSVTRMGHPGAPDHDHHRSVWFAHHKLEGEDFWSELGGTTVRQLQWYALEDGDESARIALQLAWNGIDGQAIMLQEVVIEFRPAEGNELLIEVQSTCAPAEGRNNVVLNKTNFGLLAVRVSKSLSQAFGRGTLTADDDQTGEPALFGKQHRWVDYSGASPVDGKWFEEGITYFDHPSNTGFPNAWHVRADGWMCASPCFNGDVVCSKENPLTLRYLLHVHAGVYDPNAAEKQFDAFAASEPFLVQKSTKPHTRYEVIRNK